MAKTLVIILGAGASHDLIGNRTGIVRDQYTPPLADQLFTTAPERKTSQGYHGEMAQAILEEYPKAKAAAATLGLKGTQTLESAMKAMQDSKELHIRRQFAQVPIYLRHLFWEISEKFTSTPVNYVNLLSRVLGSDFERAVLITTNYDTFLERALASLVDADFSTLDSYISNPKWALVKLHGSVNWALTIDGVPAPGGNPTQYLRRLDELTLDDPEGVTARLHGLRVWDPKDLWTETQSLYPALVVPVEGKYQYLCPDNHVEVAQEIISRSENFLVIGSSGLDDDLVDLLRRSANLALTLGVVSKGDAGRVRERFRRVPMFDGVQLLTRIANKGFSDFISQGGLSEFLAVLYDDSNRDPWSEAMSAASGP